MNARSLVVFRSGGKSRRASRPRYSFNRCAGCDEPLPAPERWLCDRCKKLDLLTESRQELREAASAP